MNVIRILTVINAILICIFSLGAFFIIPEFAELFKGFGAELPIATLFVLESYKFWPIFLIVPVFIYVKYLTSEKLAVNTEKNLLIVNISILVFMALLLPLLVYVMYLPIFEMGKAVNG
jgi:type II secretory pathway component PulF